MHKLCMKLIPGVVLVLLLGLSACTKARQTSEPITSPMPPQVATKIETAMKAPEKAIRMQALAPELREAYLKEVKGEFAVGTTVKINRESFKQVDEKYGLVEAEVSGQGIYALQLLLTGGEWVIFDMRPKEVAVRPATSIQALKQVANIVRTEAVICKLGFDKRTPVLFVHGLNGNGETWKRDTVQESVERLVDIAIDVFDYEDYHSRWVDHPNIGPKLAQHIACLANESRKAGGLGKVIVVAHSMGGLATRFAANQTDEFTGKKVGDSIGLVVTIGTPHKGTPISDVASALLQTACNFSVLPGPNKPPLDGIANCKEKLSAIFGMQAFMTSGKVDQLPVLPTQVPLLAIAGDVRSFVYYMGVPLPVFGSDLIVPVSSAAIGSKDVSKGGGVEIVKCLSVHPYPIGNPASCEHSNLIKDSTVKEKVVAGIQKYLDSIKVQPFTFYGLSLQLPPGWKVENGQQSDTKVIKQTQNCTGACARFEVWGPSNFGAGFFDECGLEKSSIKFGGKNATSYTFTCPTHKTILWLTEGPALGVFWNGDPHVEAILRTARWS